jgi:hypothetical protein
MDNVGWMAMGLRVIDIGWLYCCCDTAGCRAYTSEDHKMGSKGYENNDTRIFSSQILFLH